MGSQRIRHDLVTKQQHNSNAVFYYIFKNPLIFYFSIFFWWCCSYFQVTGKASSFKCLFVFFTFPADLPVLSAEAAESISTIMSFLITRKLLFLLDRKIITISDLSYLILIKLLRCKYNHMTLKNLFNHFKS